MSKVKFSIENIGSFAAGNIQPSAGQPNRIVMMSVYDLTPNPKNTRALRDIQNLAEEIELVGGVQQPLIVQQENGKNMLYAGHCRRAAVIYLLEQKKSTIITSPLVPVIVHDFLAENPNKNILDASDAETLALMTTNRGGRKTVTPFEDLEEIDRLETVHRKIFDAAVATGQESGRFRTYFANKMGLSETVLQRIQSLHKLVDEIRPAVEHGTLNLTAAAELTGLSSDLQVRIFTRLQQLGDYTVRAIKTVKHDISDAALAPKPDIESPESVTSETEATNIAVPASVKTRTIPDKEVVIPPVKTESEALSKEVNHKDVVSDPVVIDEDDIESCSCQDSHRETASHLENVTQSDISEPTNEPISFLPFNTQAIQTTIMELKKFIQAQESQASIDNLHAAKYQAIAEYARKLLVYAERDLMERES